MTDATPGPRCALVADQQAVAEAVAPALRAAGVTVVPPAGGTVGVLDDVVGQVDVALLLHGLAPERCVHAARDAVESLDVPWLVVASTERGPGWGAVLEAGATWVVDAATTSVDAIRQLVIDLAAGAVGDLDARDVLIVEWQAHRARRERLEADVAMLSPAERDLLLQIHRGCSPSGREVDELLARLDLATQMAAIEMLDDLTPDG